MNTDELIAKAEAVKTGEHGYTDGWIDEAAEMLRKQHHMISWRDTRLLSAKAALAFRDVKIRELTDEVEALEESAQEAAEENRALTSKVDRMLETIDRLHQRTALQEREIEALNGCGACHACLAGVMQNGLPVVVQRMILCPQCGNKRCPKATNHRNNCTNSNEPNQRGDYE